MTEVSDSIRNLIMQSLFMLIWKKKKRFGPSLEACGFCWHSYQDNTKSKGFLSGK